MRRHCASASRCPSADSGGAEGAHYPAGMKVLVTGGAGYIGSTTAKALEEAGHTPIMLDSLLTGPRVFVGDRIFYEGDIADRALLRPGRRGAPRPRRHHPHGGAHHRCRSRSRCPTSTTATTSPSRWSSSTPSRASASTACCSPRPRRLYAAPAEGFEVREDDALDPPSPYARTKRMMEQVLAGHRRRDRPARGDPALLQPDRLRPRPDDRHLRQGAVARPRPARAGRPRPAGRLHDHRHRPPDARRHRHPRLHPRLGRRPGPRARDREVRRGDRPRRRAQRRHQRRARRGRVRARAGLDLRAGLRSRGAGARGAAATR